jgi:hypothetical protein
MIMKTVKTTGLIAILCTISSLVLSACGGGAPATPTADPGAVYTMAAATVQAQLTQAAAANPTAEPPTPTVEVKATNTPAPSPTVEMAMQPTLPFGNATAAAGTPMVTAMATSASGINPYLAPTSAQPAGYKMGDYAEWQYNIPADNAIYYPGNAFQMEVGFKNVGTITWTENYALNYIGGTQMSGITSIPLKTTVKPGEKAIFITDLHAPGEPNTANTPYYKSLWELVNQSGAPVINGRVFIQIIVKRE